MRSVMEGVSERVLNKIYGPRRQESKESGNSYELESIVVYNPTQI
jgi:hypothetical protein